MGGVSSGQKFRHFARFSAPLLPNPRYAPVTEAWSLDEVTGGRSVRREHGIVTGEKNKSVTVAWKCNN